MAAFRAFGKHPWLDELRKIKQPPADNWGIAWNKLSSEEQAFWKKQALGSMKTVWGKGEASALERQGIFSTFVRENPWYQRNVISYYYGTEMQDVGKSVYKKHKPADPLGAIANRRLGVNVAHWYASGSKVMSSSARSSAVKLESGEKGWVIGGKFRSEHTVQMTLRSLDHTVYAEDLEWSLEQTFLDATPSGRREIMEMLEDVDWEAFWKNYYPQDDGYESDLTYPSDVFYGIADKIEALAMGRGR